MLSRCVSFFSAFFFPFKMRALYKKRKANLDAKGVRPSLKRIILYRSALARAVSLQPLIDAQGVANSESASQPPSSKARASGGVARKEGGPGCRCALVAAVQPTLCRVRMLDVSAMNR